MSGGQDEGSGDLGSPKLAQGIVGDSTAIPSCFFFFWNDREKGLVESRDLV